jgi:hypothetical protein
MKLKQVMTWRTALAFAGLLGLMVSTTAGASTICDTADATANGADADECQVAPNDPTSADDLTNFVNTTWGEDDPFTYIGKFEKDDGKTDQNTAYSIAVTGSSDGLFEYEVKGTEGEVISFVLVVAQAPGQDGGFVVGYYWQTVTLDITGTFKSVFTNPQGIEGDDYTFIAGFVRPGVSVPEPGSMALLGAGLLGLAFLRRRMFT